MKIDIHTHIMPENMPNWVKKFGYGDFIHLEHRNCEACMIKGDKLFRVVEDNCFKEESRLNDMQATQVDVQVLSTIPVLFNYWAKPADGRETARFFNDHIAGVVQKQPHRFVGLGTLPMQDVEMAMEELERCVNELGLVGVELGTHINGLNWSEDRFIPFFKRAEELNCALFIHPWEMMGREQMQKYWLPWLVGMPAETSRAICSFIFGGVFEKFPKLRVAFAHGGGSFPATIGRIGHGFDVRPDLVAVDNDVHPSKYIGRFWIDSLVHDAHAMKYIMEVMGEDYICLGSDYPFPLGEHVPGKLVQEMALSSLQREKILYKNALNWMGSRVKFSIEPERFQ